MKLYKTQKKKTNSIVFIYLMMCIFSIHSINAQQVPDTLYNPIIKSITYKQRQGTTIHIDNGHRNFHTRTNRFLPFSRVLEKDGYNVVDYEGKFTKANLEEVAILVISNALHQNARPPFMIPTKSAFTTEEVAVVAQWVKKGGSLFLIADHMPFAGAAAMLAKEFDFEFYDSFVFEGEDNGIIDFTSKNKMLNDNVITSGRNKLEEVSSIRTFTGQGFKIPKKAVSILSFNTKHTAFLPKQMWVFDDRTKKIPARELSQGAYTKYGKGRLVIFGEAAMFTGQLAGPSRIKVGMNADEASENYQLLLNIIHWLDKLY
ncbi:hypothetical protein [Aquimarina rhabdastrellae]